MTNVKNRLSGLFVSTKVLGDVVTTMGLGDIDATTGVLGGVVMTKLLEQ